MSSEVSIVVAGSADRQIAIEQAKAAGTWQLLPDEPRWAIPEDLQEQLGGNDAARSNFESFPPSSKRLILEWIAIAKRPDTRRRRIDQTVNLAALNIRANHPFSVGRGLAVGKTGFPDGSGSLPS